jgi:hypothetical protein
MASTTASIRDQNFWQVQMMTFLSMSVLTSTILALMGLFFVLAHCLLILDKICIIKEKTNLVWIGCFYSGAQSI